MQAIKNLLDLIPAADAPAEQIYRWRLLCVVFGFFVTWSMAITWGHFPWVSKGLAHSQELELQTSALEETIEIAQTNTARSLQRVEDSISKLTDLFVAEKERALRNEIFQARQSQCRATAASRNAAAITSRLVELRSEYVQLTGRDYPVPACNEVM